MIQAAAHSFYNKTCLTFALLFGQSPEQLRITHQLLCEMISYFFYMVHLWEEVGAFPGPAAQVTFLSYSYGDRKLFQ